MTDTERIADLELRLLAMLERLSAMHEYNKRLMTVTKCHDAILKAVCGRLGIEWEVVELPPDAVQ